MFRAPVLEPRGEGPSTVVVKRFTDEEADDERLLREWSGARFLSGLSTRFGPGTLGGDPELRLVVLDDLGTHPSLADRLLGDDPDAAEAALLDVFAALGRLNGATAGREGRLDDVRAELGERLGDPLQPDEVRAAPADATELVGAELPTGTEADVREVLELFDPSPWRAFSPSDVCPDNNALTPDGVRFFDLEGSGFWHALWDGAYARILFPTCWCVGHLPEGLPERLEAAYRAELAEGVAEAADDEVFDAWMLRACAGWTLLSTKWLLPWCLEKDPPLGYPGGPQPTTFRRSVTARLEAFNALARQKDGLPALRKWAESVSDALAARWPDEAFELDLYPAFR